MPDLMADALAYMTAPPRQRVAIVLFNLGGPDRPEAIRPFLKNLFLDPAILRVPFLIRPILARIIARARVAPATANYALLGGRSPLLELTERQARALEHALAPSHDARCFIAMRYWHPFSADVARAVRDYAPDRILLLPLYPHFSTTTTGSSLSAWRDAAAAAGLVAPVTTLCCWPEERRFAAAIASLTRRGLEAARAAMPGGQRIRVLFSAHGLPETIIARGDPYQFQIEASVDAVRRALDEPGLDSVVCYQSRATPQKWLDPSTESEIERAAADGVALLVVPIAFVSEHSETLVELDVEYRELAEEKGVQFYFRVPAPNDDPAFIAALAGIAADAIGRGDGLCSHRGGRLCPANHTDCPFARSSATAPCEADRVASARVASGLPA